MEKRVASRGRTPSGEDPAARLGYRQRFDSVAEAERLARRRLPGAMFERLDRGADDSVTFAANRRAYSEVSFRPRAAAVYEPRSTRTTVLGAEVSTPVLLAPVGALRLQHPAGVQAAVAAATRFGTVCAVSPAAGHSLEEIPGLTLDGIGPTLAALPEVVDAVAGQAEVLLDGGIRTGADVAKALALGARAVLIGRAYVMGLAVGGAAGVHRVLELLDADLNRALGFLGCAGVSDLGPGHITVPGSWRSQNVV